VLTSVPGETCNSLHRYPGSSRCDAKHNIDRAGEFDDLDEKDDRRYEEVDFWEEEDLLEDGR